MKRHSVDLRERMRRSIAADLGPTGAARLVGVGKTTIKRWKRRPRDAGTLARAPCPGRRSQIAPDQLPTLEARLRAAPDATLTD